jgi:hypothetical protein
MICKRGGLEDTLVTQHLGVEQKRERKKGKKEKKREKEISLRLSCGEGAS